MPTIATARRFWEEFVARAQLHVDSYDEDLPRSLRTALGISPGTADLGADLERERISVERFVVVLLRTLEPFPTMMSDLCRFFQDHGVRRGREAIRIVFDFDAVTGEEVSFDLQHFREWEAVWKRVREIVNVREWTQSSMWGVNGILRAAVGWQTSYDNISRGDVIDWIRKDRGEAPDTPQRFAAAPPRPPLTGGSSGADAVVNVIHELIADVVAVRAHFGSREGLWAWHPPESESVLDPGARSTSAEIPLAVVHYLERDNFVSGLTAALWLWVERLDGFAADDRAQLLAVVTNVQNLVGLLPTIGAERDVLQERLEAIFALPIWRRRSELYSAWLLTVVERAFDTFAMTVHTVDGTLRLTTSAPHVATLARPDLTVELLTEYRTEYENPVGDRSGHIQPDYILSPEIPVDTARTLTVLEVKQYLRASVTNFSEAAIDYAGGHPNANVIIADYGPISARSRATIEGNAPDRIKAIGDVNPVYPSSVQECMSALTANIPPPAFHAQVSPEMTTVFIDVSGSMADPLHAAPVVRGLADLAAKRPDLEFAAFDEKIRSRGRGDAALRTILNMAMTGGTDIVTALRDEDVGLAIIVTDDDGLKQVRMLSANASAIAIASAAGLEWLNDETTPVV